MSNNNGNNHKETANALINNHEMTGGKLQMISTDSDTAKAIQAIINEHIKNSRSSVQFNGTSATVRIPNSELQHVRKELGVEESTTHADKIKSTKKKAKSNRPPRSVDENDIALEEIGVRARIGGSDNPPYAGR